MAKINIEPVKHLNLPGIVGEIISEQNTEMNLEDFLNNVKVWENLLKRKVD